MNYFPSQMERMGRRTGKILRRSKVPKGDDFLDDIDKYFESKTEKTTINPESETSSQLLNIKNDSNNSLNELLNFLEPESPIDDEVQKSFKALSTIKKRTSIVEGLSSDKKLYDILAENTFFNKLIKKNTDCKNNNTDDEDKMSFPSTSSDEEEEEKNNLLKSEIVEISDSDHLKEIKLLTQKYNNKKFEMNKTANIIEIPLIPDNNKIKEIEKIASNIDEKIKNKLVQLPNVKKDEDQNIIKNEIIEIIDDNTEIEKKKNLNNKKNIQESKDLKIIEKNKIKKNEKSIEKIENTKESEQFNDKIKKEENTKQEKTRKNISQETITSQKILIQRNTQEFEDPLPQNSDPFEDLPILESNKKKINQSKTVNKFEPTKNKEKINNKKKERLLYDDQNNEKIGENPKGKLKIIENNENENNFTENENKKTKSKPKKKQKNLLQENTTVNMDKNSKTKSKLKKKEKELTERELAIKAYNEILETGKTQLKQIIKTNENFGNENRYPCRFRLPRICYWRSDPVFIEKNSEGKEVLNYYKLEEDKSLLKYLQPTKRSRGGTRKLKKNSKKIENNNENPEIISEDGDSIVSLIKLKNEENREFGRNIYGPIFCTILKCQDFKLNVRFPDKLITLSRGDKFVIPPNTVYSMENLSKKTLVEISCKIMK